MTLRACHASCAVPCSLSAHDPVLLADIHFTQTQLHDAMNEADALRDELFKNKTHNDQGVLKIDIMPEWAPRLLRKKGIAAAVIEKIGSLTFVKRRPDDVTPFLNHVQKKLNAQEPLLFRVAFGPLKNIHCSGDNQRPDLAEYLTLIQLARLMSNVAPLYPHGIKVQLVPDDRRAMAANKCPECFTHCYIQGLREMVAQLGFADWMSVEEGQARLYDVHHTADFFKAAEIKLRDWQATDIEAFNARWYTALDNARKNIVVNDLFNAEQEIEEAAWRYMIAHQAEILSGMWSVEHVFPLVYANHPNCYQVYSLGYKKTKLPWQISLPMNLVAAERLPAFMRAA